MLLEYSRSHMWSIPDFIRSCFRSVIYEVYRDSSANAKIGRYTHNNTRNKNILLAAIADSIHLCWKYSIYSIYEIIEDMKQVNSPTNFIPIKYNQQQKKVDGK